MFRNISVHSCPDSELQILEPWAAGQLIVLFATNWWSNYTPLFFLKSLKEMQNRLHYNFLQDYCQKSFWCMVGKVYAFSYFPYIWWSPQVKLAKALPAKGSVFQWNLTCCQWFIIGQASKLLANWFGLYLWSLVPERDSCQ